jgi:hypothetical protein
VLVYSAPDKVLTTATVAFKKTCSFSQALSKRSLNFLAGNKGSYAPEEVSIITGAIINLKAVLSSPSKLLFNGSGFEN